MESTISIVIGIILLIIVLSIVFYIFFKKKKTNLIVVNNEELDALDDVKIIKEENKVLPVDKKNIEEPKKLLNETVPQEEVYPTINISSKTEKEILRKLDFFEKNKGFIKKDVNLNSLSKQFNTNTKYLSEIIKIHRNKQFNSYLNELRISYITNRLLNEPNYIKTKITYLASDCGYSSHSTFTTIFTQIMNESPSVYIKRIKKDVHSK
ncbi:helix-turn-helix transcriptional regulator [Chishuiella sp.]|uniref:helix-turn-helix domain-containing protein n=1 Tax=Chishuiella sp. TaxID=1969467 RepID=UPI0028A7981F|nr:helix-turn-helix transcriptional regulator [Chishuiella sp.]